MPFIFHPASYTVDHSLSGIQLQAHAILRLRTHGLRNLEIAQMCYAILRSHTRYTIPRFQFRECVIAQIPRLRRTYILYQPNATPPGSKHEERIQLWSTRSRSLLQYADIPADRQKKLNPNPLTATEQAITTFTPPMLLCTLQTC